MADLRSQSIPAIPEQGTWQTESTTEDVYRLRTAYRNMLVATAKIGTNPDIALQTFVHLSAAFARDLTDGQDTLGATVAAHLPRHAVATRHL